MTVHVRTLQFVVFIDLIKVMTERCTVDRASV